MYSNIFILFLVFFLFGGENVLSAYGFNFTEVTMIFFFVGLAVIILLGNKVLKIKEYLWFMVFAGTYAITRFATNGVDGLFRLTSLLFGGIIMLGVFATPYQVRLHNISKAFPKILITFYIAECLVAIYERTTGTLVFGMPNSVTFMEEGDMGAFRSCSLLGHPLQNALIVTTIMTFILFSSITNKWKYSLWLLGYLSILCFNARSSMVGNILILFAYVAIQFNDSKNLLRGVSVLVTVSILLAISYYFMSTYEWGGRLIDMGLVDDTSAQVRINAFNIFDHVTWKDILWGYSKNIDMLTHNAGIGILENFWIGWLLQYGIFVVILFVLLMFFLLRKLYKNFTLFTAIVTAGSFWLTASTNNSLSWTYTPEAIFFLCVLVFSPNNKNFLPSLLR